MNIVQVSMIAIAGVILALILKNYRPEYSMYISMVVSLIIFGSIIAILSIVSEKIGDLTLVSGENRTYYGILFKILGITYLCEFSASICKDAGYQSIASQVELFGKLTILLSGMPVIQAILETLQNFN